MNRHSCWQQYAQIGVLQRLARSDERTRGGMLPNQRRASNMLKMKAAMAVLARMIPRMRIIRTAGAFPLLAQSLFGLLARPSVLQDASFALRQKLQKRAFCGTTVDQKSVARSRFCRTRVLSRLPALKRALWSVLPFCTLVSCIAATRRPAGPTARQLSLLVPLR